MQLFLGDCLEVMPGMESNSIDAIVTDPPYGLSFMNKHWDYDVPSVEIWTECLRVLKPGGHLLSFAGTRTHHRMAVNIEDAGFEIRDMIAWVYGSGFPKSMDVSKAIDKAAGVDREDKFEGAFERRAGPTGNKRCEKCGKWLVSGSPCKCPRPQDEPVTDSARQRQGWGTALKPALEPITVARKPLIGTVVENVLTHGTGALNIDGCRVGSEVLPEITEGQAKIGTFERGLMVTPERTGRWPANLIHDGGECFGEQSRFFYCAKASKKDRDENNNHPTVKPTDLMRYLCRLVTPPGGIILDPFMGSGSTGKAAKLEGFDFIGIERDESYFHIAKARIEAAQ